MCTAGNLSGCYIGGLGKSCLLKVDGVKSRLFVAILFYLNLAVLKPTTDCKPPTVIPCQLYSTIFYWLIVVVMYYNW